MLSSEECIVDSRDDGSQDHHANPVGWISYVVSLVQPTKAHSHPRIKTSSFRIQVVVNKARDRYSETSIRGTPEEAKYVLTSLATASGFSGG